LHELRLRKNNKRCPRRKVQAIKRVIRECLWKKESTGKSTVDSQNGSRYSNA
jgi:hypothetical protein